MFVDKNEDYRFLIKMIKENEYICDSKYQSSFLNDENIHIKFRINLFESLVYLEMLKNDVNIDENILMEFYDYYDEMIDNIVKESGNDHLTVDRQEYLDNRYIEIDNYVMILKRIELNNELEMDF